MFFVVFVFRVSELVSFFFLSIPPVDNVAILPKRKSLYRLEYLFCYSSSSPVYLLSSLLWLNHSMESNDRFGVSSPLRRNSSFRRLIKAWSSSSSSSSHSPGNVLRAHTHYVVGCVSCVHGCVNISSVAVADTSPPLFFFLFLNDRLPSRRPQSTTTTTTGLSLLFLSRHPNGALAKWIYPVVGRDWEIEKRKKRERHVASRSQNSFFSSCLVVRPSCWK